METKKVLITGSGGFVCGNLVRKVFKDKVPWSISSIDRIRDSNVYNIYTNKDHSFYPVDINDRHILNCIFQTEKPDMVIHGAANMFGDDLIKTNVEGTQNVIDACLKWEVNRLVYLSSDKVNAYCHPSLGSPVLEIAPLNPRSLYAVSKTAAELLITVAHEKQGLQYQIIRPSNAYGPWQAKNSFIPKIIKGIIEKTPVQIFDQGNSLRDWIHVSDLCSAIIQIANNGAVNSIYNVSANQEYSNIEVFQHVCNAFGTGYDLIEFVKRNDDTRYANNSNKLRDLGWNAEYKFKEGIAKTATWYSNNKWFI